MKRRAFLAATAAAAAAGMAPARAQIYSPQNPQQYLQQLTIALNVTLSGEHQHFGEEVVKGAQAAIDETNRFTTLLSRVFGIRTLDDRNQAALAISNVSVFQADPSVLAVIGNLTADMTIAALPRYANANFAVVVPTVTADSITERGYHNVYRLPTKDYTAGGLFARSVLDQKHGIAAIAIALDGDYGYDVARGFVAQAKSAHFPADTLLFPKDKTDPAAAARAVLDRSPNYVFLSGKTAELGPIAAAMRLNGYAGDFGASDGFYNADTINTYATVLAGSTVASSLPPLERVPSIVSLLNDFQHEVGSITAFSAYGYAAAQLLISASQRGSSTNRFSLLTAMQQGGVFNTLVGQYNFTITGDPLIPNIYLYTIDKEGFKFSAPAIRSGFVV
jgi:branched-chain amino acid transport system substrate-binding protein